MSALAWPINAALCRMGYEQDEMTDHGFRAMVSILLNELGNLNPDAIERQLAHKTSVPCGLQTRGRPRPPGYACPL